MVKIKVLSRSKLEWTKDRSGEVPRAHRNFDPNFNPMAKQVEYTRAVRAAKLDRMFAKPFVSALARHQDTVECMALDPTNLGHLLSGGMDGEVILWEVATNKPLLTLDHAHRHSIEAMVYTPDGVGFLTASRDKQIKLWDTDYTDTSLYPENGKQAPLATYLGASSFTALDHHWHETKFVSGSLNLDLWDVNRTKPIHTFQWGDDTVTCCRFNKVEADLVALGSIDRGVCIHDTRTQTGHSKVIMEMACNSLAWNPMDPNVFIAGSDDWNCYLFDIRVPGRPRNVFQGHIRPVLDVDFSPTGQHFVAGSQDNTLRIWDLHQTNKADSTEMLHTKRMSKVHSVRWSLDNNYIFSGSEDAVVRVWKSDVSKPIRPLRGPETTSFNYMRTLKDKYKTYPEVRKIVNQRNTPHYIRKTVSKKKSIVNRNLIKEMARKKSDDIIPLTKKKVVQSLK